MSEEAAKEVASVVRQILARFGASSIRKNYVSYQENAITSEIQYALDGFRSRGSHIVPLADYAVQLVPVAMPKSQLPSKEERAARILMGLHPEPAAFACRLHLKFVSRSFSQGYGYSDPFYLATSEYTVMVTAEDDN